MSVIICNNCNETTNSAVSEFWKGEATKCYARFMNNEWVKGCAYDECDPVYDKPILDEIIANKLRIEKVNDKDL